MKKNLTFLTGIVFVITILLACGSSPANDNGKEEAPQKLAGLDEIPKKVIITIEAIKIGGVKRLVMYDSNNPDIVVVDNLETIVNPGDTVCWEIVSSWKLKKIEKIGPKTYGNIINKDAEPIPGTKSYRLIIPENAPWDTKEKYDIECKGWIGKAWPIDPYLRVPPTP